MIRQNIRGVAVVQIAAAMLFSPVTFALHGGVQSSDKSSVNTENGLSTITYNVRGGTVKVHLPADMAAGDTITGTVIAEPTKTANETGPASDTLNGIVLDLGDGQKVQVCEPCSTLRNFVIPHVLEGSRGLSKISVSQPGAPKLTASVPLLTNPASLVNTDPNFPPFVQAGRPVPITGAFDGNAANTQCTIGDQAATLLAESPRSAIFRTPANLSGPARVQLTDRTRRPKETHGSFNFGLPLTGRR